MNGEQLALSHSSLYNSCITLGKWPTEGEKGEQAAVHEKADKDVKENYRPIPILNTVDKVFEKELSKQATQASKNKLSQCLTAYMKQNRTVTLLSLMEDLKSALDKKLQASFQQT